MPGTAKLFQSKLTWPDWPQCALNCTREFVVNLPARSALDYPAAEQAISRRTTVNRTSKVLTTII
jgi:hypothetical protein